MFRQRRMKPSQLLTLEAAIPLTFSIAKARPSSGTKSRTLAAHTAKHCTCSGHSDAPLTLTPPRWYPGHLAHVLTHTLHVLPCRRAAFGGDLHISFRNRLRDHDPQCPQLVVPHKVSLSRSPQLLSNVVFRASSTAPDILNGEDAGLPDKM